MSNERKEPTKADEAESICIAVLVAKERSIWTSEEELMLEELFSLAHEFEELVTTGKREEDDD